MSGAHTITATPVVLDTGLFEDRDTLRQALESLNLPESNWFTLTPDTMNESDWDKVLTLVLSTNRVITL
ncbi:MAG: hypothetical protein KTR32_22380 [Granulosicoccus sp.]|nr:hypothetical protein [Granulosicoccus sp.]